MTSINNTNMQGVNAINANQTKQPAKVEAKAEEVKAKTMDQLKKDFEAGKLSAAEFKAEAAKIGADVNVKTNKDIEKLCNDMKDVLSSKKSVKEKGAEIAKLMGDAKVKEGDIDSVLNQLGVNGNEPGEPIPDKFVWLAVIVYFAAVGYLAYEMNK